MAANLVSIKSDDDVELITGFLSIFKIARLGGVETSFFLIFTFMPFGDLFSSKGGGFDSSQAFFGRMSRVNVWSYVVHSAFIQEMSTGCGSWNGNAVAWFYFKDNINGNIEIIRPSSCSLVGKCVQSHLGVYTRGNQLHRCCNVNYKALAESTSKPQWMQRSGPIRGPTI